MHRIKKSSKIIKLSEVKENLSCSYVKLYLDTVKKKANISNKRRNVSHFVLEGQTRYIVLRHDKGKGDSLKNVNGLLLVDVIEDLFL